LTLRRNENVQVFTADLLMKTNRGWNM
jgi:hypothetical protein